jgi:pyruvate formate lyase activating enzyme
VRFNQGGRLMVPRGYVAALQCDPVEKKPFFHVLPGTDALTFGMLGCDFHCGYCQNWVTSQALRDERAGADTEDVTPETLVSLAERQDARIVVSSYNEPLITAEWAAEVFEPARRRGFVTGFVSNGNATAEALDFVGPLTDCYKIDLKTMDDRRYRQLGGVLAHVLDAIGLVHQRGIWLEVLTLIVPGFSDDPAQLRAAARYIAGIDRNIPWHVTAFHEDYHFRGMGNTAAETLVRACEIGAEEFRFVYAGTFGARRPLGAHLAPAAGALIERLGYRILRNRVGAGARCPDCGHSIRSVRQPSGSSRRHGRMHPACSPPGKPGGGGACRGSLHAPPRAAATSSASGGWRGPAPARSRPARARTSPPSPTTSAARRGSTSASPGRSGGSSRPRSAPRWARSRPSSSGPAPTGAAPSG